MKWLDIFTAWCTILDGTDETAIDEVIKHGQFLPEEQAILVQSNSLNDLVGSLVALGAPMTLLQLAKAISREHNLSKKPFFMRVEADPINLAWHRQCEFLFSKRVMFNWRSLLCFKNSRLALEYVGQSWTSMQPLANCNPTDKELSVIVFQLLWTFSVLARCQIFLPITDWCTFFSKVFIQRNRVDYFGGQVSPEVVFFMRGEPLDATVGVYRVPVRNAFVHICYEPKDAIAFGHEQYYIADRLVSAEPFCYGENYNRKRLFTESDYLAAFALQLRNFLFPQSESSNVLHPIFNGLSNICGSQNSVMEFLNGPLANEFYIDMKAQDRTNILRAFVAERTITVLHLPRPEVMRPVHQRNFRSDWIGFPNVENNCFLNSVLFMLMCPIRTLNSFAETIETYESMGEPTDEECELIRKIKETVTETKELEKTRRILARLFSLSLKKAFSLSTDGRQNPDVLAIEKYCSNLLPVLDLWSMATRGQYFTQNIGEYQDLDECLRLLYSLLLFESCCTATIAITEEFPNLEYKDGEKLTHEEMEQRSLLEKNNPLCLRVASTLESPIIRFDWSTLGNNQNAAIDLQSVCAASQVEHSIVPAPLSFAKKEIEKKTSTVIPRCTRFNLKRILRSRGCKMAIIHIFRQSFDNEKMIFTVKRNLVSFPKDETLLINGTLMRIQSLSLWSNSHYTCLFFCNKTMRWWHVNDMLQIGRKFQEFGATLAEAMELVNRFGLVITTVTCVTTLDKKVSCDFEQQCFVELPKLFFSSDTMQSKAILFHKDDRRLLSAGTTMALISTPFFDLPSNFLFGHDDPNDDFIFRDEWFENKPLSSQKDNIVLVLASGLTPVVEHSLALPLDYVSNLESSIAKMTSITVKPAVDKARLRAQTNLDTMKSLELGQQITVKQFANICSALNVSSTSMDVQTFMQNAGENNALFQCNVSRWIVDVSVGAALFQGADNVAVANLLRRKKDYQMGQYFGLEKIIIPFYSESGSGFVVLVEPQKNLLSLFDPRQLCNTFILQKITSFLVYLGKQFFGRPNELEKDWRIVGILGLHSLSINDIGFYLLYICGEILANQENLLFNGFTPEKRQKKMISYIQLFSQIGELKF